MDPKAFYGTLKYSADIHSDSEDSDLSSDELENTPIQPPDNQNGIPDQESDYSSEDDLTLAYIQNRISKNLSWKEGHLIKPDNETQFRGNQDLPSSLRMLETPFDYFTFLFPKSLIEYITEQSNLYNIQCQPNKPVNIKNYEIEQFIGICMYTSLIQLPSTRDHWVIQQYLK